MKMISTKPMFLFAFGLMSVFGCKTQPKYASSQPPRTNLVQNQPEPPVKKDIIKAENSSPDQNVIAKLNADHPLLGYLQINDLHHLEQSLGKTLESQKTLASFLSLFPKIDEKSVPMTLLVWSPLLDFRFAILVPLPKEHPSLQNWLQTWKTQYPSAEVHKISETQSALTLWQSGSEQIQTLLAEPSNVLPLGQNLHEEEDIQLYVHLPALLEKYGYWFEKEPSSEFHRTFMGPMMLLTQVVKKAAPNLLKQFESMKLGIRFTNEEILVSLQTQYLEAENSISVSPNTELATYLPPAHVRFTWSTPQLSKSTSFPMEVLSELEPPVLLRPLQYMITQIEKNSRQIEISGSLSEPSPYGINNVLIVSLQDESAAKELLSALQQAAAWRNEGEVHETRKQELHENVHVSIRPACRKIEGFDVDCYYPRIQVAEETQQEDELQSKNQRKRKVPFTHPYSYQAVRIENLVFVSWNMDQKKTTLSLNQTVKTYLQGKKGPSLVSEQKSAPGGYLYMDINHIGTFLSILGLSGNDFASSLLEQHPILLSGYREGKTRLYKLVLPRALLP